MHTFYRLLSLLIFLAVFIACTKNNTSSFSIQGSISPVKEKYILLKKQVDIELKKSTVIDTIFLTEKGTFKADYNLEPYLYSLQLDTKNSIPLAIDKGQHITIKVTHSDTKITGSVDTDALLAYENFRIKSLDSLVQSVRRNVKAIKNSDHPDEEKIKSLEQLEVKNYELHLSELNEFIKSHMGSTIGLYAASIRWKGAENLSFYDSLTTAFETVHPNLKISTKLREKVTRLQQTSLGGTAADIEMNTAKGTSVSLSSAHKKYTLIDFWASWCGPCRSESKTLGELYEKYNKNGFEIYGVSLDDKKDKWTKAIEKDNRIWTNVSSLEAFKTKAAYDYTVTSLPMNYLIDTDYKIVGKNLHLEELESLLAALMEE